MKLIFLVLLILGNLNLVEAQDVCVPRDKAIDIITLLDGSERDIKALGTCQKLVNDLFKEIEVRDEKISNLTKQLIHAKQENIEYRSQAKRWKKVAWYSTAGGILVVILQIVPSLL